MTVVTIEDEEETAPKLSNGTTFNDFEWPLSHISTAIVPIFLRLIAIKIFKTNAVFYFAF